MDVAQPGRGIGCDISKGEIVEAEIDAFIAKRHDRRVVEEGHRTREELWAASERRYFARRDEEACLALLTYHEGKAARLGHTLGALVGHHEAEAERCRRLLAEMGSGQK
jgi:hypothetical protein